jgi:plastocyanin
VEEEFLKMNTLDSRFLRFADCFAQRFSSLGTFHYRVSPLPASLVAPGRVEDQLTVVVEEGNAAQQQHTVNVSVDSGQLIARPGRLEISAGDIVRWSADNSVTGGFVIQGTIGGQTVNSAAMRNESIFTHAFGLAGDYKWVDANGSDLSGTVRVIRPGENDARRERWLASLAEGTLIRVIGERAEPKEVEILVGQTVFWSVENAPGVTVTDANVLLMGTPG